MKQIYHIQDLEHYYSGKKVLDIPRLKIDQGEILGLVGPNGCGKSTLLRLLSFLESPTAGTISFKGRRLKGMELFRKEVSLLLQNSFLLKRRVYENVAYGLRIRKISSAETDRRVKESLFRVGLEPGEFGPRQWYELSGGERQRVALASRLAIKPSVLLLDEPTASVDLKSEELIKKAVLMAEKEWKTTIVLVSHDYQWLQGICNRILSMNNGEMVSEGQVNTFPGPWKRSDEEGLCVASLSDEVEVFALGKGDCRVGTAVLPPSDVVLATGRPEQISTRNCLRGVVERMFYDSISQAVMVTVSLPTMSITAMVTKGSIQSMGIEPGEEVWVLFKASSFRWV